MDLELGILESRLDQVVLDLGSGAGLVIRERGVCCVLPDVDETWAAHDRFHETWAARLSVIPCIPRHTAKELIPMTDEQPIDPKLGRLLRRLAAPGCACAGMPRI